MRVQFIEKAKKQITKKRPDLIKQKGKNSVSDYSIAIALNDEFSVRITTNGLANYSEKNTISGRIDVICALRRLAKMSWEEYGKLMDDEFLKKN